MGPRCIDKCEQSESAENMFSILTSEHQNIRKLPYPFQGAFSISNDIDRTEFSFFNSFMQFLNTTGKTPFGNGLGLNITSSFFFFRSTPNVFSYFSDRMVNSKPTRVSDRMNDYLMSGWMDTIHAYGDFDNAGGFTRGHAERGYELLEKIGVPIRVFTNHGTRNNSQNIGSDQPYHRGDLVQSRAYHADLMVNHGIRYVWTDTMVFEKQWYVKRGIRDLLVQRKWKQAPVMQSCVLQDGSYLKGFKRFRSTGTTAPNLSSFGDQLNQINWKKLYAKRGAVILYQHLGVISRGVSAVIDSVRARPERYLAPFYFLKQENLEGRLWVCGLAELLTYVDMLQNIRVAHDSLKNRYEIISNMEVENPEAFFQGLTVYHDPKKPVSLVFKEKALPVFHNDPDETGRYSVTIPISTKEDIW